MAGLQFTEPVAPPHGVPGLHQRDPRRASALVPPFETAFQTHRTE
jgi:hypothetical protein